ncbi:sialate O-acetylesterase [uncultured Bacteroides sp.]|uniref:sialate O-acetylesterase n=1 Tax=uncultured Bacteroides sp. TaxID=162156 RepID=UPI00261ED5B2|nr:sialate O-acetylesterase [uncultured Bacteroides sp.]
MFSFIKRIDLAKFCLLCFGLNVLILNASNNKQENLDIYVCIGQSNMAGRAVLPPELTDTLDNVFLLNSDGVFEKAVNPLNRYSNIRKDISMQRLSPAYEFGITISRLTKSDVGLVVNARGGSSINSWIKGSKDGYYEKTLSRIREAMKYGVVKAILWHQGETDCASSDKYMAKLQKLITDLRTDLGMENLPVVVGQISRWDGWTKRPEGTKAFNEMITTVPDFIPNSGFVTSEGIKPYKDEFDPHFDTGGQLLLGKRYAYKVIDLLK